MTMTTRNLDFIHTVVRVYANRMYQQDRWRILERRENAVKAASVILGTAAFAEVKGFLGNTSEVIAVLILSFVAVNVVALVFQWGNKARDASKRSSEWTLLERDIQEVGEESATTKDINAWRARCAEIEAGEPSINEHLKWRALQRACEAFDVELERSEGRWERVRRYWYRPWPRAIS
jgi:hypothetical protein